MLESKINFIYSSIPVGTTTNIDVVRYKTFIIWANTIKRSISIIAVFIYNDNNFSVALSETTDGGMTISSSFSIVNEGATSGNIGTSDMDAGFSLAFTDGSKLDVINAGNASGSHDVSIPGSAGAEGATTATSNAAETGLDFMTTASKQGVESVSYTHLTLPTT